MTNKHNGIEIFIDRRFTDWLTQEQISLAYTTYQTSRLMLVGVNPENGRISGFERLFDRAMGLYTTRERMYLSCKYQIWQLPSVRLLVNTSRITLLPREITPLNPPLQRGK